MVASIAGLELALLVSLARLLAFASVDLRRKIAVRGLHPLALANYGHRRKIVVSVRSDCDHRRKIVVSGRRRMTLVVVLLVVLLLVASLVVTGGTATSVTAAVDVQRLVHGLGIHAVAVVSWCIGRRRSLFSLVAGVTHRGQ